MRIVWVGYCRHRFEDSSLSCNGFSRYKVSVSSLFCALSLLHSPGSPDCVHINNFFNFNATMAHRLSDPLPPLPSPLLPLRLLITLYPVRAHARTHTHTHTLSTVIDAAVLGNPGQERPGHLSTGGQPVFERIQRDRAPTGRLEFVCRVQQVGLLSWTCYGHRHTEVLPQRGLESDQRLRRRVVSGRSC
jgi:hypothetical protein